MVSKNRLLFYARFLNNHSLLIFFIIFTLMYFQFPLMEFFLLVPLYWYLKFSKKIEYKKIILLIFISTTIIYLPFIDYGLKYFTLLYISFSIFILTFIYIGKKLIKKKLALLTLTSLFFLLFTILGLMNIENYWLNLSGFLSYFPFTIKIIGSYGLLILILLFNYNIFYLLEIFLLNKEEKNSTMFNFLILIILFIHFFIFPHIIFQEEAKNKITIAAIQGNLDQSWEKRIENKKENYLKYINLSNQALIENPQIKIIIWPEYVFTHEIEFDFNLLNNLKNYSKENKITLIFGSFLLENQSSISSKRYNTLYVVDKGHFYFYNAYLPIKIFDTNTVNAKSNYEIKVHNSTLGFALCYEENFPEIFQKQIKEFNSEIFIIATNQYLLKNTQGFELSALNSNIRAAEFNRYLIRVSNNGLTKIVDNNGIEISRLPIKKEGFLIEEVPLINSNYFYLKNRTNIDFFYILLSLLCLVLGLVFSKHNKN